MVIMATKNRYYIIWPLGSLSTTSGLSRLYNAPNVPLLVAGGMPSRATLRKEINNVALQVYMLLCFHMYS